MKKPLIYRSGLGWHCSNCGSFLEVCGDPEQCAQDSSLEIEEAIIHGDEEHPLLKKAHELFMGYTGSTKPGRKS